MAQQDINSSSRGLCISTDPETRGFDISSGSKWFYPENYPRRDYQFTIVQTALYNNTLVCLPTGLGKTFIAAVVMYNFWRWYPRGRVVFMAPTKPLVAQQIEACHEIMGIPSEQTVELTGAINQTKRKQAWSQKRVIFATPQTFQKDLQNDCVPCDLIKCIVIDEAHKALGKHSYCEIVRMLNEKSKFFRILALSATPGSKIDHVREVIQNLLISELELRDDTSPDITPYTNNRSMEKIIVHLDKDLNDYKDKYINIMDPHVRILVKSQLLQGSTANISKGRIFVLMKQYESRPQKAHNHGIIMKTLNILLTMYHAYELLVKHGLRAFYNFYINHSDKFWYEAELDLKLLLEDIKRYIGDFPVIEPLPDGSIPDIPDNIVFGHNKFNKLRDLLVEHFKSFSEQNKSTRAIVFVEYRDIVNEVYVLLLQTRPLIRPQMFVGQAGQKQKVQIAALEDFRNNKVNVLISTSVGEEGLDVGEVDLIVCFDISTSTPTRLVQRMGRTGRKRNGRVVLLLTEGKEVQTLNEALSKKDSLNNKVLQSSNITSALNQSSPRMIPSDITPECYPIFIKAQPKTPKVKGKKVKPVAEKKPRKKKDITSFVEDNDIVVEPSSSKTDLCNKPCSSTQSSMMKFLTDQRTQKKKQPTDCNYDSDSGILSEEFQNIDKRTNIKENPYAVIKASDVKLLTSDTHSLEFLTLCAMKKSEQESLDKNIINVDTTWIPVHSPVDIFNDFVVPSLDTLDCIKYLTFYEKSVDEEMRLNSDESLSNFPSDNEDNDIINNRESNYFEPFAIVESKYVTNPITVDLKMQEDDEVMESDFFDDFSSIVESKYADKITNSKQYETEISTSVFSDTNFTSFHAKNNGSERSKIINLENEESTDRCDKKFSIGKEFKNEKTSELEVEKTPAHVEVDFTNILDEYTESEASESQALIEDKLEEANIFDELLEEDSMDEDLFDISEEKHDITAVPSKKLDETLVNSTKLSTKRGASCSPCRESLTKKQKLSEADSDDDCVIVLGTPPKSRENRSFVDCNAKITIPKCEVDYPDSDQDLFDDIEFETEFTFDDKKNITLINFDNVKDSSDKKINEVDETFDKKINDISLRAEENNIEEQNKLLLLQLSIIEKDEEFKKWEQNEIKDKYLSDTQQKNLQSPKEKCKEEKNISSEEEQMFEEFDTLKNKEVQELEQEKKKNKHLSNVSKCVPQSSKNSSAMNLDNFELDNWDDFDFAPIVIEKTSTENEEISKFFSTKSATSSVGKSRSQESFSSGWISRDSIKNCTNQTKKTLSLKNFGVTSSLSKKSNLPLKVDLGNLNTSSTNSKKPDFERDNDDNYKILNVHNITRPNLSLLSLKKNFSESVNKDEDGFAIPKSKLQTNSEFAIPKVPNKITNGKENKLPRWIENKKKDNSISPRFRRYHSEKDLRSEQRKKKKRKRLINDFIEDEAEVSSDVDTSEGSSGEEDRDLDSFVSYTQEVPEEVDMKAHYLQTINKSPIRAGAFMFKQVRNIVPDFEIYSQPVSQVDNTYIHDSFCVGDDIDLEDDDNDTSSNEDSIIENIEISSESRSKRLNKRKRSKFECLQNKKRNRNKKNSSNNHSSSEDETEALRRQVLEESQLLKQGKH